MMSEKLRSQIFLCILFPDIWKAEVLLSRINSDFLIFRISSQYFSKNAQVRVHKYNPHHLNALTLINI